MTLSVSVVIPTYNRKESLRLTLDGLACQTLPICQWEAIVVSDGSTDGTNDFVRDYAQTAPFVLRPIVQPNGGPSTARNRGIEEATGDIIVFVDDDVEPSPEFLATHLRHHRADPSIAVIGPLLRDPSRRRQEPVWIGWEHAMLEKQYSAFRTGEWSEAGPNHFYSGNASALRIHLLAVGGFDTTFTRQEDVEMAYRLQRECNVHYIFDGLACALHRPVRTCEAWLKIPYEYGQWDVVRARNGDIDWGHLKRAYRNRNLPTRLLARFMLARSSRYEVLQKLLFIVTTIAYSASFDRLSFLVLSAIYNIHYLSGARQEMSVDEINRVNLFS